VGALRGRETAVTDVVVFDEDTNAVALAKALPTPVEVARGVQESLAKAAVPLGSAPFLIHGSTVVVNAIIERKGARTALVTTQGFRDVYEIGRINRPESFNPRFRKHRPLVPRELVFEVPERMLADAVGQDIEELRMADSWYSSKAEFVGSKVFREQIMLDTVKKGAGALTCLSSLFGGELCLYIIISREAIIQNFPQVTRPCPFDFAGTDQMQTKHAADSRMTHRDHIVHRERGFGGV
jgi:hypothetical protein